MTNLKRAEKYVAYCDNVYAMNIPIKTYENMIGELKPYLDEAEERGKKMASNQAWLGNATTRSLIEEIKVRIEVDGQLDYKTTETDEERQARKGVQI